MQQRISKKLVTAAPPMKCWKNILLVASRCVYSVLQFIIKCVSVRVEPQFHHFFRLQGGVAPSRQKKISAATSTSSSSSGVALFKALLPVIFILIGIALIMQQTKA